MNIEILKEHLESAVASAARISNKNLSLQVLGCAVIVASKERTVIRATNLDVSVEIIVKAKVIEEGVVAVPAHILSQAVSTATAQKLTLKATASTLTITGGAGTTALQLVDASEFPTLPYVKEGEGVSVTLPSRDLVYALKMVVFSSATTNIRPELASVFLSFDGQMLIAAATDSFRLAEVRIPLKSKQTAGPVLIPARNIPDILRIAQYGEFIDMRMADTQCTVLAAGSYITSRIIDGAFPDYGNIIPKDFMATATLLTEDAVRAFKKAAVFTDASHHIEVSLLPSKKVCTLRTANAGVGEAYEEIPAALEGDDAVRSFNVRYITDALSVVGSDGVVLKIPAPGKPLILEENPKRGFLYLVMPMNK